MCVCMHVYKCVFICIIEYSFLLLSNLYILEQILILTYDNFRSTVYDGQSFGRVFLTSFVPSFPYYFVILNRLKCIFN